METYTVYILYSESFDKYYIGQTFNIGNVLYYIILRRPFIILPVPFSILTG